MAISTVIFISEYMGGQDLTWSSSTTRDVGSGTDRFAVVLAGYINNSTPSPTGVSVGTDALSAQGAAVADNNGYKWRVYTGDLTVSGAQTISGTNSASAGGGGSFYILLVLQGAAAVTYGNHVTLSPQTSGSSLTRSRTVTSASGDVAYMMGFENNGSTSFAASGGSTLIGSATAYRHAAYEAWSTGTDTTVSIDWTGAHDLIAFGFTLTEASASSIAALGGKLQNSILLSGLVR